MATRARVYCIKHIQAAKLEQKHLWITDFTRTQFLDMEETTRIHLTRDFYCQLFGGQSVWVGGGWVSQIAPARHCEDYPLTQGNHALLPIPFLR